MVSRNRSGSATRRALVGLLMSMLGASALGGCSTSPGSGELKGVLERNVGAGGPNGPPAAWQTISGTVSVRSVGRSATVVDVGPSGRFGLVLPAGNYIVTVTSPPGCVPTIPTVHVQPNAIAAVALQCGAAQR